MQEPSGRRWLIAAVGLFLVLLVVWIAAAVRISASAAAPSSLMSSLRSRLSANYSPDPAGNTVRSLRLSIFQEALQDLGMSSDEAATHSQAMQAEMQAPVPTATARDFQGAKPLTATPTVTPIPTQTPTPTATVTRTPRPTPTKTKTPEPTAVALIPTKTAAPTAVAPMPTNTPSEADTQEPGIWSVVLSPAPSASLDVCVISVTDMEIRDPAFSLGMRLSEIYIKYEKAGVGNWQPTLLSMTTGDFVSGPDSEWRGHFNGSFTLNGLASGDSINVMGKAKDNAGHWGDQDAGSYMLAVDCSP
jgi:hypothetical protein